MQIPVIIDISLALVLLFCICFGIWRGLFRSLAGLAVLILALIGANFLATALTPPVTNFLRPALEERISQKVDQALSGNDETDDPLPQTPKVPAAKSGVSMPESAQEENVIFVEAKRILSAMGFLESVQDDLSKRVEETVRSTSVSVTSAVVDSLLESFVHTILFLLAFIALSLVLRLVAAALDLVLKLPGLHLLNAVGGGFAGLLQGVLLLFLAFWALERLGIHLSQSTIGDTYLLQFFVTNGPLGFLSSI